MRVRGALLCCQTDAVSLIYRRRFKGFRQLTPSPVFLPRQSPAPQRRVNSPQSVLLRVTKGYPSHDNPFKASCTYINRKVAVERQRVQPMGILFGVFRFSTVARESLPETCFTLPSRSQRCSTSNIVRFCGALSSEIPPCVILETAEYGKCFERTTQGGPHSPTLCVPLPST
jgi:hypothetical protein